MDVTTTVDRLATLALCRCYGSPSNRDAVRFSVDAASLTEIAGYSDAELAAEITTAIDGLRPVPAGVVDRLVGDLRDAVAMLGSDVPPVPTSGAETA